MNKPPFDSSCCSEHDMHDTPQRGLRFSWWPAIFFLSLPTLAGAIALYRLFF